MSQPGEQMNPLMPHASEMVFGVLTVAHTLLLLVVVLQVLRGRLVVPHGLLGVLALLLLPVVGPLLVLTWQGRVDRHRARAGQVASSSGVLP